MESLWSHERSFFNFRENDQVSGELREKTMDFVKFNLIFCLIIIAVSVIEKGDKCNQDIYWWLFVYVGINIMDSFIKIRSLKRG